MVAVVAVPVAVVAVLSTSQQNFKNVCKEEIKNTKIMQSVNTNTLSTATSATKNPTSIDISSFSAVAVPKSSATSTATTATKNCSPKGGKEKIIRKGASEKYPTTII